MDRFEIGIRENQTGKMMNRDWSRSELEQSVAWLKRMNAKGNDIYVRPAGEHGLVLVDDLNADALKAMRDKGYDPAAVIETSPGNYQAWVKLSDQPVSAYVRTRVAQAFAREFGGDLNSAESRHYGRLAGFTNQKSQYDRDGKQPYVLAHECSGEVAIDAQRRLERVKTDLDVEKVAEEKKTRLEAINVSGMVSVSYDPVRAYRQQAKRLLTRYGDDADLSRLDWMIATDMAKSGRWDVKEIEKAIREASPNLTTRKVGHIGDYAKRTAEKAWNDPEAQQERAMQQAQHRGPSLER